MQRTSTARIGFYPVTFQKDWEVVRKVAEGSGRRFNRANYDKQTAKEAETAAKKLQRRKTAAIAFQVDCRSGESRNGNHSVRPRSRTMMPDDCTFATGPNCLRSPCLPSICFGTACPQRGDLDAMYCDANGDLMADPPGDPKQFKNPSTFDELFTAGKMRRCMKSSGSRI